MGCRRNTSVAPTRAAFAGVVAAAALVLAMGLPLAATAQDAEVASGNPATAAQATALAAQGLDALGREDWLGAYDLYRAAWDLLPDPSFAYNLAGISETVGRLAEALRWYETYLEVAPQAADAADVRLIVGDITAELERTWTRLRVTSAPPDATAILVRADTSVVLGQTPLEVWAEPGRVTIRLEREGYADLAEPIVLEPGSTSTWAGALQADEAPAPEPAVEPEPTPVAQPQPAPQPRPEIVERRGPGPARIALMATGGAALAATGVTAWLSSVAVADFNEQVATINPAGDALLDDAALDRRADELATLRDRARNTELAAWALGATGVAMTLAGALMPASQRDPLARGLRVGPNNLVVRW